MCLSFKILNLFGMLSPRGSSNCRPSAPFLYEVASHVKNCHFGDYYYYYIIIIYILLLLYKPTAGSRFRVQLRGHVDLRDLGSLRTWSIDDRIYVGVRRRPTHPTHVVQRHHRDASLRKHLDPARWRCRRLDPDPGVNDESARADVAEQRKQHRFLRAAGNKHVRTRLQ